MSKQTDIPDLIAGPLGVSRGTAYDLMRDALAEQAQPSGDACAGAAKTTQGKAGRNFWSPGMTLIEKIKRERSINPMASAHQIALQIGEWVPDVEAAIRSLPRRGSVQPAHFGRIKTFWQPVAKPAA